PLFQAYLKVSPGDAEVEKRVSELMAGEIQARAEDAERKRIEDGYQALKDKDLKTAERLFSKATAKKEDLDALVGLSVVALQQEQFDKAVVILQKVKQLAPQRKELWERSLESAEFWDLVTRAKKAVAADKWDEAEQLLGDAIKRNKKEAHHARMLLGNVYVKKGEMEKAEDLFDAMVQEDPKNVPALKALVELYLEAHRGKRAIEVNDKLAALDASAAYDPAWLRAETMRYDASELRKTGDLDGAKELLEVARQTSPTNKRVLYDYAYLAVNMSDTQTARGAVSALRDLEEPGSIDLIILEAWVFEAEGRYNAALELLDRVPKEQLDERTKRLKTRVEVRSTSALALQLAARKPIAARHRLVELQHRVGDDPELLGLVAIAWADLGATDRALTIIYDAIGRAPRGVSTLKLQLAAILHKAGREDELLAVLRELEGDTELSIGERRGLEDLRIAHAVRRADVAREKGDHTRAFNILAIPLRDYPNDPRLMNALGRLFVSAQEHEEALRVFGKVLEALPEDLDARSGAVESAIRMGRLDIADKLLEDGLRLMPNNPRMHAIAGRAAVLRGEDGEAMDSFKKALALDEGQNPTVTVGDSALGDPGYRSMLADAATRFTGDGDGTRGAGSAATLREEVQREMDEIRDRHSSSVGGGFSIRLRDGLPGYGKITEVSVPITLSLSTGYKGRLAFTATPIVMEPGDLDLDDELTQYDYGLNAYDWRIQGNIGGRYPDRGATGIELMLEFNYRAWTIRAGSTPLGFLYQTAVGGIEYRDQFDAVGLRVRLDRTPVKDSVLSYAGERDLLTGAAWGAVTRNGGRVDLSFTDDDMLYYLYGGGFVNIGDRVPSNAGGEVGLGVRWTLYDWEDTKLITGAGASGLFYGQNLRHFTFGQGGYFSPQLFLHAGIPLDLSGGAAKLKYRLGLDLGVNWFTEEATPYFPTDPNRQALLQGLSDEDGFPVASYHEGQRSFAFAVNFEGALQWRITETFDLGVHAEFHTGHDYQEFAGGIFLGYAFDRKKDDDIGRLPLQGF
ncbi:MAG: BCSC C-terminal domain-containing protein, partial [Myxococcales bacterium]|nr:BCSC C-terminal domain-containing protein [Myxococcales bacterium]